MTKLTTNNEEEALITWQEPPPARMTRHGQDRVVVVLFFLGLGYLLYQDYVLFPEYPVIRPLYVALAMCVALGLYQLWRGRPRENGEDTVLHEPGHMVSLYPDRIECDRLPAPLPMDEIRSYGFIQGETCIYLRLYLWPHVPMEFRLPDDEATKQKVKSLLFPMLGGPVDVPYSTKFGPPFRRL